MRAFIGLEFSDELKSKLLSIQKKIIEDSKKGTWVNKENFHMTLKFLGDINEYHIEQIGDILRNCSKSYTPIELKLDKIGYFNNDNGKLRVLWLGVLGELEKLNKLYKEVNNETFKIGFEKERRRFKPHITLGRRIVLNNSFKEIKAYIEDLEYNFTLDKISLLKSEKIMQKRVYTPIKSYEIGKNHS